MEMFGKWFRNRRKADNSSSSDKSTPSQENSCVQQEPSGTQQVQDSSSPDPATPGSISQTSSLPTQVAEQGQDSSECATQPSNLRLERNSSEFVAAKQSSNDTSQAIASDKEPEASASQSPTQGGLRSLWEGARRLALTPVDPWFSKVAQSLDKTRQQLVHQVSNLFTSSKRIDEEFWEELEDILLTADVGVGASTRILDELQKVQKEKRIKEPEALFDELKVIVGKILRVNDLKADIDGNSNTDRDGEDKNRDTLGLRLSREHLNVIMMVGVNGVGKTTTTAKLAAKFKQEGFKVILAAADTFRAAAVDQLQVWAHRVGVDLVRHQEGSDPGAVVFDAIKAAQARHCNVVLIDTAGRLHNKAHLMEELRKIRRVADKACPGAPQETLLVLDATTGQNALEQTKIFNQITELTGLVMCKLDGTGKGGIVIAIGQEFNIPVRYIGVGEAVEDLREFDPSQFLEALFAEPASYKELEKQFSHTEQSDDADR